MILSVAHVDCWGRVSNLALIPKTLRGSGEAKEKRSHFKIYLIALQNLPARYQRWAKVYMRGPSPQNWVTSIFQQMWAAWPFSNQDSPGYPFGKGHRAQKQKTKAFKQPIPVLESPPSTLDLRMPRRPAAAPRRFCRGPWGKSRPTPRAAGPSSRTRTRPDADSVPTAAPRFSIRGPLV